MIHFTYRMKGRTTLITPKQRTLGLLAAAIVTGAIAVSTRWAKALDATVVVTQADLESSKIAALSNDKWFFYNDESDTIDNTLGTFVSGPGTPPFGSDSVQISVSGTQRRNLATYQFRGTPLALITTLAYSTYNPSAGNSGSANRSGYLQFNVSFDGVDTWQRRLVYIPADNGTVVQNSWKEWNAIDGGNALWRYSGPTWPGTVTPGTTPRTWSDILTQYPNAQIRQTDAFFGVRVGEPYADGYTENLDAVKFGTATGLTTFDFEQHQAPSVPAIVLPSSSAVVTQSALTKVDWTDSTGTHAPFTYQYEAYSDAAYSSLVYSSGWLGDSEIPTAGTPIGTYYLRVRAMDSVGAQSAWSNGSGTPYMVTVVADPAPTPTPTPTPVGPPTHKNQCKQDGWKIFTNPVFKNQGSCVSFVTTQKNSN